MPLNRNDLIIVTKYHFASSTLRNELAGNSIISAGALT